MKIVFVNKNHRTFLKKQISIFLRMYRYWTVILKFKVYAFQVYIDLPRKIKTNERNELHIVS